MNRANPDRGVLRALAPLSALMGVLLAIPLWALAVRHLMPRSGLGLAAARELGLVSQTVLSGYDKGQEGTAWLLGCLLVPLGLAAGWIALRGLPGAGRRATPSSSEPEAPSVGGPPPWVPWVAVGSVFFYVVARPGFVWGPNPWGSFGFLGEEGVYLGAVQAMRTGRVLYEDLAFPYGPLLIQPLDWFLRVFGDTVVVARSWVLLLHGLGMLAVAAATALFVGPKRGPWAAVVTSLVIAAVLPPFLPTLNGVLLRPAMAILPAAVAHAACRGWLHQGPRPFAAAGALVALGGLLSFEIAGVAVLSTLAVLLLLRADRRQHALVWGACAVAGGIGLLPLTLQGGLPAFFATAVEMVRLPALGYQALPYPDVASVFRDAGGAFGTHQPTDTPTLVWALLPPLVIWTGLGIGLTGASRAANRSTAGLLVAGVACAILFRGALGRSDLYHLWFYGAVPVVVLCVVICASLWERAPREGQIALGAAGALLLFGLVSLDTQQEIAFPSTEEVRLGVAVGLDTPLVARPVRVGRTGRLELLPRLAQHVEAVTSRAMRLPKEDGVWFYPSEASFYFLADRAVPVRYLWAYDAATPAMQRRAIADLESSRPRWVFRSSDTFEIDHIPQWQLVPQLDAWLAAHYRPVQVLPGATLLERVGEAPPAR